MPTATSDPPQYAVDECKSCKAPIIWAVTTKGDRMPIDAEPVAINNGGGNIRLTQRSPGYPPVAEVVRNPARLFGAKHVYRSHFATCPHAAWHRRPRPRRTA